MTKTHVMKAMMLACAMCVTACAVDESEVPVETVEQAASSTTTRRWNGKGASVQYGDPTTQTGVMLFANDDQTTRTASVYIDIQGPDLSSWSCPFGSIQPWICFYTRFTATRANATLSAGELVIRTNPQGAEATLTATVAAERCVYDTYYFGPIRCEPVSVPVDLTWTANGLYSEASNGTWSRTMGNVTMREKGSYTSISTNLDGTVGDLVIANGFGMINDTKGTSVTREIVTSMP